jgi:peptide/nickel transport system ATP-binding protein
MTVPLLSADAVSKEFALKSAGSKMILKAVDNVSLILQTGETLGLAGESGCGKSTIAKIIAGLLAPNSGTISFKGNEINSLDQNSFHNFRRSVQMIFQDPFSSLNPRMRIGDTIAEPLHIHRLCEPSKLRGATIKQMDQVGLAADQYDRFPHEFSGGQRQRIGIARALAARPDILIADEPVSSLDISIQAQIINLLQGLKHQYGLTLLMVSHDLGVLRHVCDRIAVMYLGTIVELAPALDLFHQCRHPYSQILLAAIPRIRRISDAAVKPLIAQELPTAVNLPNGCSFHPRCPYAEEVCRQERPPLVEQRPGHFSTCHLSGKIFST